LSRAVKGRVAEIDDFSGTQARDFVEYSTSTKWRWFLRPGGSNCMKECKAPENVEARLVTAMGFLGHALYYGQIMVAL
jgi:hypothetical protein